MLTEPATKYPRYGAPREDGQALVVPRGDAVDELLSANRSQIESYEYDIQGRSLTDLIQSARNSVIKRAVEYTKAYRNVPGDWPRSDFIRTQPMFVAGHQPELVHPGVWFKNFVLGNLAKRHNGIALQLIIDSDLCRTAAIRVPTGSVDAPRVEAVAYDSQLEEQPYEERRIDDLEVAASFPQRVDRAIKPFIAKPLAKQLWPQVMDSLKSDGKLGLALARGRHSLEAAWGNETLELPASQIYELDEFRQFACLVLADLPRFRKAYNEALNAFRQAHGIRNRAQPLPNLSCEGGLCEAPFWIWSANDPTRRPLWVERLGDRLQLTDRVQIRFELKLTENGSAEHAIDALRSRASQGIKIRTRALLTTLFARLVLSDMFLHGIGGAKYDQVTDDLAQRFFSFALPGYMTLSATLRLPIPHKSTPRDQVRDLSRELRELTYHPEKHVSSPNGKADQFVANKRKWIATPKTPSNAAERHRAIVSANESLQPWVADQREALLARQQDAVQELRASTILDSREYAFCLFPENELRGRLLDLAGQIT